MKSNTEITKYVQKFLKSRSPGSRYASFDYCFSYFQSFLKKEEILKIASPEYLQLSCLQLASYLSSWGMYRGSSFLLKETSCRYFTGLIHSISELDLKYWQIDADNYTADNIQLLLHLKDMIIKDLRNSNKFQPSDTLITKILLGIFGNIPAFDRYVTGTLEVGRMCEKNISKIDAFYSKNKHEIDELAGSIKTIDFNHGADTDIHYTKAKIIDMYAFQKGLEKQRGQALKVESVLGNTRKTKFSPADSKSNC